MSAAMVTGAVPVTSPTTAPATAPVATRGSDGSSNGGRNKVQRAMATGDGDGRWQPEMAREEGDG